MTKTKQRDFERGNTSSERLTEDALRKCLATTSWPILAFGRVRSTNDVALDYASKSQASPHGTLVVAEYQTRGRGRFQRRWFSPPHLNLLFSLVVCPEPRLPRPSLLTLAMGVSVVEAVEVVTGLRSRLKWPNDICLSGKKLGGILTEAGTTVGGRPFWVVGVGVNVNTPREAFPPELFETATSLRAERGEETSRLALLVAILDAYEKWCDGLFKGNSERLLDTARRLTTTLGRTVAVRSEGAMLVGVAFDLDDDGALLVRTPVGHILTVTTTDHFVFVDESPMKEPTVTSSTG